MTEKDAEKYVRMFHQTLYRLAFSYVRECAAADDVCQDAFVQMLRQKGFPTDEDCKRWLIRVTINRAKDTLRSRKRFPVISPEEQPESAAEPVPEQEISQLVRSLPQKYSGVIHLYYYEGYSVKDIAQILGISVTAVTSRLSRV